MKQHTKTEHMVIKATKRPLEQINVDGHVLNMDNKHHQNYVSDAGLAREIQARHSYGTKGEVSKDVVVVPVTHVVEHGHTYFFGSMPEMPWKKKE